MPQQVYPYWPPQRSQMQIMRPRRRPPKPWRLRREYWLIPLVSAACVWFITHTNGPAFTWAEVMNWMGVHDQENYTSLALCGLCLIGVVACARVLRGDSNDSDRG